MSWQAFWSNVVFFAITILLVMAYIALGKPAWACYCGSGVIAVAVFTIALVLPREKQKRKRGQ